MFHTLGWFAIALLAMSFLVYQTPKESFWNTFSLISWPWIVCAIFLQVVAHVLSAFRWTLLLKANEIYISKASAVGLTYLGLFYNNVMPGGVGGDLLKGWYVTRHCPENKRMEAAVSVFIDRALGLLAILVIGNIAALFIERHISYRGFQLRWLPIVLLISISVPITVFLSQKLQRMLRVKDLIKRLPFGNTFSQIDDAIQFYKHHKGTVLYSLVLTLILQVSGTVAFWFLTQSLQFETVRFVHCLAVMPMTALVSIAIPVPGGMGVVEGSIMYLFCVIINPEDPASALAQAAALALMNRIVIMYICSLPGALIPLLGGHLPKREELKNASIT